jgi:hypothetical protein
MRHPNTVGQLLTDVRVGRDERGFSIGSVDVQGLSYPYTEISDYGDSNQQGKVTSETPDNIHRLSAFAKITWSREGQDLH